MSSSTSVIKDLEALQEREVDLHQAYSELIREIENDALKSQIKLIRDQGLNHIEMVTTIISILKD
jgi:hypothetical protein